MSSLTLIFQEQKPSMNYSLCNLHKKKHLTDSRIANGIVHLENQSPHANNQTNNNLILHVSSQCLSLWKIFGKLVLFFINFYQSSYLLFSQDHNYLRFSSYCTSNSYKFFLRIGKTLSQTDEIAKTQPHFFQSYNEKSDSIRLVQQSFNILIPAVNYIQWGLNLHSVYKPCTFPVQLHNVFLSLQKWTNHAHLF